MTWIIVTVLVIVLLAMLTYLFIFISIRLDDLQREVERLKGDSRVKYGSSSREVAASRVIDLILDHLGLEMHCYPSHPEEYRLMPTPESIAAKVEMAQNAANEIRSSKPKQTRKK